MTKDYAPLTYSWLSHDLTRLTCDVLADIKQSPSSLRVDAKEFELSELSPQIIADSKYHVIANWDDASNRQLSLEQPDTLRLYQEFLMPDIDQVLNWLSQKTFSVCIGGRIFADWPASVSDKILFPGQYEMGWMLAFKGEGHRYLVSERWLDYAPVKVHRLGDVTLIQFHDLHTDSQTALAQAQLGWKLFDRSIGSGFLGSYKRKSDYFDGQYNADEGALYVTVFDHEPSLEKIKDACYAREFLQFEDGQPINKIIYVFIEPELANRWVYELWLRNIECRTFIDGAEVILSDAYVPSQGKKLLW